MIQSLSDIAEVRGVPLHASGLADYETCPRKFLFRHRAGLVPKSVESSSLLRGTMLHAYVAEVLREGGTPAWVIDALATGEKKKAKALLGPSGYLPGGATLDEAFAGIENACLVATAMSRAYCRFFGVNKGQIGALKIAHIEVNAGDNIKAGTLDAVSADGWVIDHKTHSRDLAAYAATLPLAPQSILYPSLANFGMKRSSQAGNWRMMRGIIYNIIKTPTIKCCKTDDFDINKYAARVEQWYQNNADTMLRTTITMGPEQIKLHNRRIRLGMDGCVSLPIIEEFPATGGTACSQYNSTCPFLPLCTSDTVTWKSTIERLYDKQWRDNSPKDEEETE